jgi:predicted RNA methylase
MQLESTKTRYSGNFTYIKGTVEATHLETYGEYKQKEINLLSNLLSSNEGQTVIYDVGAGVGVHTMAFSKLGNVVAFEADEVQYKVLDMNTNGKLAPNVLAVKGSLETTDVEDPSIPNFDHQMMKLPPPTLAHISSAKGHIILVSVCSQ